jgi:hypothetical protein
MNSAISHYMKSPSLCKIKEEQLGQRGVHRTAPLALPVPTGSILYEWFWAASSAVNM